MGLGRSLIVIGLVFIAAGALVMVSGSLPIKLGKLPGDIVVRGKNSVFYFPLATSILLSLVLTALLWLFGRR